MKPYVPILMVLLLVSTGFVGVSNTAEETKVDSEQDELLNKLAFYCYGVNGLDTVKYEYYKEKLLEDTLDDEIDEVEVESQSIASNPISTLGSPPMDSAWPMKCHDTKHTGRSPFSTANNPGDEIWRFETDGWIDGGSVIDDDGTIYFGGNYGGLPWYLIAIHPNGTLKWRYKTGGLIWSTPAIAEDGTIYIGSWDDYLYAINPNGTLKWKIGAGGSIASSPAIADDGTVYFGTMRGFDKGDIMAVNPNGTEKWCYPTGYYIVSGPAIGDDGTIYIGSGDTYIYAMNPNGTLQWRFKTGDYIKGPPSIADDGTIYIGSWDDYLYALYPNNGTMKWRCQIGQGTETNPSIGIDGTIYIGSYDGHLYAVYHNGTLKWSFNVIGNIHQSSPAISADGIIYFGTDDSGYIYAVNPNGTERWRKKIANLWVESSPSIAEDGTVYIGSSSYTDGGWSYGYLYAFNRAELKVDSDGPHYGLVNEPVQFNGTASGGYRPYSWHWDFGDGNISTDRNPMHTYTTAGNYTVTLTVTDNTSNTTEDSTWAWIQESNDPPDKPSIDGETNGKIKTEYDYTFLSSDPEELYIWYFIDWRDGTDTGWIGPYPSDKEITVNHKWSEQGDYNIRCKAKDPYDAESDWGELKVTIPKSHNPIWWINNLLDRFPLLQRLLGWLM